MDILEVHLNAIEEAKKATAVYLAEKGEDYFCGFAWAALKMDGRSPESKKLIKAGYAVKGHRGDLYVWNPGGSSSQCMSLKEAGAEAYVKYFNQHSNFKAIVGSRPD